jgi:ribosomal protein L11 methyltransferase
MESLNETLEQLGIPAEYTTEEIPETNWNQVWESNYSPIWVENKVYIHATFHPAEEADYEVVIDPKMSFGTGHHETTYMMAASMLEDDFTGHHTLDFGSGTGILAILARKMNAPSLVAIDHEEWAYNNCIENVALNKVDNITVIQGDESTIPPRQFGRILANVNKNVIFRNLELLHERLEPNGLLYLSGLLHDDEADIMGKATALGFQQLDKKTRGNWICLKLKK